MFWMLVDMIGILSGYSVKTYPHKIDQALEDPLRSLVPLHLPSAKNIYACSFL